MHSPSRIKRHDAQMVKRILRPETNFNTLREGKSGRIRPIVFPSSLPSRHLRNVSSCMCISRLSVSLVVGLCVCCSQSTGEQEIHRPDERRSGPNLVLRQSLQWRGSVSLLHDFCNEYDYLFTQESSQRGKYRIWSGFFY